MSAKGRRETTQALGNQGSLRMAWSPGGAGNDALPLRTRRRLCLVAPGSGWRLRRPSLHVGREGRGRRPSGGAARGGGRREPAPGGRAAAGGDVARWTSDAEGRVLPEGRTEAP